MRRSATEFMKKVSPRAAALGLVLLASLAAGCRRSEGLQTFYQVPSTTLLDDAGRSVNLDEMKGYVTVYNFIFTRCAGTCPIMTNNMRELTKRVDKSAKVRFVSISVDPQHDTPAVMREYASRMRNDDRWTFLTGDRDTILKLSIYGFKLAAGEAPQAGAEPLLHSSKFITADRTGMIREYYGGTDGGAADHVAATVRTLLEE